MSKTDVKKLPYTPVLDNLTAEMGLIPAAVFGRVWRYCQMGQGYCHAEQERIADNLGISRKTVNIALGNLVARGYLTDAMPNSKGRTRIYKDTGKAGLPRFSDIREDNAEVVTDGYTKKEKTEKKEKTSTSEEAEVFSSFSFTEEQKTAYQWTRKNANKEKALEIAMRDNPLQSAYDYLDWLGNKGVKTAAIHAAEMARILPEPESANNNRASMFRTLGGAKEFDLTEQILAQAEPTDSDRELAARIIAKRQAEAAVPIERRAYEAAKRKAEAEADKERKPIYDRITT